MATKKNETKPKETPAVAPDAPAVEENATVEVKPEGGEKPADTAEKAVGEARESVADDPTAVPVTVLVVLTSMAHNALLLRHCLRSLVKNLREVDATVKVIGTKKPDWLADDTWLPVDEAGDDGNSLVMRTLPRVDTERIVLMTDRMQIIRPVNLADIALLKANVDESGNPTVALLHEMQGTTKSEVHNYKTKMPVLVYKSLLVKVLDYMLNERGQSDFDLPTVYFNFIYPELRPTFLDWRTDGWLLPLVSEKPDTERVKQYFGKKKFIHIAERSEGPEVVSLLKFLTPDLSACETKDVDDEDPAEN